MTQRGQTLESSPISTSPMMTDAGSMYAEPAICGCFPLYGRISGRRCTRPLRKVTTNAVACHPERSEGSAFRRHRRKSLVDLHRRAKRRRTEFIETSGNSASYGKKAFRRGGVFTECRDGLARVSTDAR